MLSCGLLMLLVLALASASVLSSSLVATQHEIASPVPLASPEEVGTLEWAPCEDIPDTECAWLEGPVDHSQSGGERIMPRLSRIPTFDMPQLIP